MPLTFIKCPTTLAAISRDIIRNMKNHIAGRRLIVMIVMTVCQICTMLNICANARVFQPEIFSDTVRLSLIFRQNATHIDPAYHNNQIKLDSFVNKVHELQSSPGGRISSIDITAFASPEGPLDYNRRLSKERARNIAAFLKKEFPDLADSLFSIRAGDINWHGLESLVESSDIPRRDEVLSIIRDTPEENIRGSVSVEQRLNSLKRLDEGEPYRYLYRNFFPLLRNAESLMEISFASPKLPLLAAAEAPAGILVLPHAMPIATVSGLTSAPAEAWVRHAYIKTNLPAWLLLWTNIAAEIDIAPHWSANVAVYYSGFNYFKTSLKFRTLSVMPEGRYWFKRKNDGIFLGVHPGLAYYNIATDGEYRYQDHNGNTPAIGGGVSVGFRFALPSDSKWKFEASVGAGIYHLDYDIFYNVRNGLLHDRRKRTFYGLDNVAFSICYTFDIRGRESKAASKAGKEKGGVR